MSMKAVIYTRSATDSSECGFQRRELLKFAERHGLEVVACYEDVHWSGLDKNCPGLAQLLKDAAKKKFSVILLRSLDRLTRDVSQLLRYIRRLRNLQIECISPWEVEGLPKMKGKKSMKLKVRTDGDALIFEEAR
jgi:site-specific DNA recombinase